jgi:hypothetical protein
VPKGDNDQNARDPVDQPMSTCVNLKQHFLRHPRQVPSSVCEGMPAAHRT